MKKWKIAITLAIVMMGTATFAQAQNPNPNGLLGQLGGLQDVLAVIYEKLIKKADKLITVASGIAGFAALCFIGSKIWRSLANAEPIDFYPLLRPFALGLCITFFPAILGMINGVLQPTVDATAEIVKNSDQSIHELLKKQKDAVAKANLEAFTFGTMHMSDEEFLKYKEKFGLKDADLSWVIPKGFGGVQEYFTAAGFYNRFKTNIKGTISEVLQILFAAAALCINTIRIFQLVVLGILGPIVFGLSVFDGFQQTLSAWFAKYVNIFLWLPVCNIFGAVIGSVQEEMLKMDAAQIAKTGTSSFGLMDTPYLIFMIIGIFGYLTVPTVAGYIVNAGGTGALVQKITSVVSTAASTGVSMMTSGASNIAGMSQHVASGYSGKDEGKGVAAGVGRLIGGSGLAGSFGAGSSGGGNYMGEKLSGESPQKSADQGGGLSVAHLNPKKG